MEVSDRKSVETRYFLVFAGLLCAVVALLLFALGDPFWTWFQTQPTGSGSTNGEALRNLGLVIVGVVGLPFVIWRSITAHRQAQTQIDVLQQQRDQFKHTERGHRHDRYREAVSLLNSQEEVGQLTAIVMLQQVRVEAPDEYDQPVRQLFADILTGEAEGDVPAGQQPRRPSQKVLQRVLANLRQTRYSPGDTNRTFVTVSRPLIPLDQISAADFRRIEFADCDIGEVTFYKGEEYASFKNCRIGKLIVGENHNLRNAKGVSDCKLNRLVIRKGARFNRGLFAGLEAPEDRIIDVDAIAEAYGDPLSEELDIDLFLPAPKQIRFLPRRN